ncbi:hypothetical protein, partial [Enterococcus phoeniculicola]|uniref:hypothetical protein n=1 Tax=Enterococcus phoeniculicola TaxID=154621 RepID=UPI001B804547
FLYNVRKGSFVAYFKKIRMKLLMPPMSVKNRMAKRHTADRLNYPWDSIDVSAYSSFLVMNF